MVIYPNQFKYFTKNPPRKPERAAKQQKDSSGSLGGGLKISLTVAFRAVFYVAGVSFWCF